MYLFSWFVHIGHITLIRVLWALLAWSNDLSSERSERMPWATCVLQSCPVFYASHSNRNGIQINQKMSERSHYKGIKAGIPREWWKVTCNNLKRVTTNWYRFVMAKISMLSNTRRICHGKGKWIFFNWTSVDWNF